MNSLLRDLILATLVFLGLLLLSWLLWAAPAHAFGCDLSRDECWQRPGVETLSRKPAGRVYREPYVARHRAPRVERVIAPRHEPRPEHEPHRDAVTDGVMDGLCVGPVRGLGIQWVSEQGAKEKADDAWMASVRFSYGEHMMDLKHARGMAYSCSRSSVGDFLDKTYHRCVLVAAPCKAPLVRVDK